MEAERLSIVSDGVDVVLLANFGRLTSAAQRVRYGTVNLMPGPVVYLVVLDGGPLDLYRTCTCI